MIFILNLFLGFCNFRVIEGKILDLFKLGSVISKGFFYRGIGIFKLYFFGNGELGKKNRFFEEKFFVLNFKIMWRSKNKFF